MDLGLQWALGLSAPVLIGVIGTLFAMQGKLRERMSAVETDLRGLRDAIGSIQRTVHEQGGKIDHLASEMRSGQATLRDKLDASREAILSEITKLKIDGAKGGD